MRYTNATQILPPALLAQVQEYADGMFLYIPRRADKKRPWGTLTPTRQELIRRNNAIFLQHLAGSGISALAEQYFFPRKPYNVSSKISVNLSKRSISCILRQNV